jgi:hypothetical protein
MQISFSECVRQSVKWYKKLFFHLLNMAVYNAFVIYKMQNNISLHLSDFRLQIIREILTKYGPQTSQSKQSQRKCVVCTSHNIRRDTQYMCPDCLKDYPTEMDY